jgi:hypothetical protein
VVPGQEAPVRRTFAVLLAATAVVSACGGDDGGSEEATAAPACDPVGEGGGRPVAVTLREFTVSPEPASVAAGEVTFDLRNEGAEPHELVVVRAASPAELAVVDGRVDEDALPAGAFIGEVESFAAGETCEGTFELTAGRYVLFCNLVEEEDGDAESHFLEGMAATFEAT